MSPVCVSVLLQVLLTNTVDSTRNRTLLSDIRHSSLSWSYPRMLLWLDLLLCESYMYPWPILFAQVFAILNRKANKIHCLCKAALQSD